MEQKERIYMKNRTYLLLTAMFIALTLTTNIFAQDYTQWHLPEGATARLGKRRITGNIAYSPDGTKLEVASSIGVWIYDAQTGEELDLLTGHTGGVSSVSFSPDGRTLASGSLDATHPFMGSVNGAAHTHPHWAYVLGQGQQRVVQSGWSDARQWE